MDLNNFTSLAPSVIDDLYEEPEKLDVDSFEDYLNLPLNDLYKEKNGEYKRKGIKNFGYCQGYMALQYHLEEAIREENKDELFNHPFLATPDPRIAIFSHKYYNELQAIPKDKEYDFCWIGSIQSCKEHRLWIIDFATKYFTDKSIFINR